MNKKRENIFYAALISAIAFYTVVYYAGLIAQRRENYKVWSSNRYEGHIKPTSYNIFTSVYKALTTSYGWQVRRRIRGRIQRVISSI